MNTNILVSLVVTTNYQGYNTFQFNQRFFAAFEFFLIAIFAFKFLTTEIRNIYLKVYFCALAEIIPKPSSGLQCEICLSSAFCSSDFPAKHAVFSL